MNNSDATEQVHGAQTPIPPTVRKRGRAKKAVRKTKAAQNPVCRKTPKAPKATAGLRSAKGNAVIRAGSKGEKILGLMGKAAGASLAEIMNVTGWQAHSVRGFLSTVSKKYGAKIESSQNGKNQRVYRIVK